MLLPVYLLLIFGIIEVSLVLFLQPQYVDGGHCRDLNISRKVYGWPNVRHTAAEFRKVIASNFLLATTEDDLKISLIAIADANLATTPVTFPVGEQIRGAKQGRRAISSGAGV